MFHATNSSNPSRPCRRSGGEFQLNTNTRFAHTPHGRRVSQSAYPVLFLSVGSGSVPLTTGQTAELPNFEGPFRSSISRMQRFLCSLRGTRCHIVASATFELLRSRSSRWSLRSKRELLRLEFECAPRVRICCRARARWCFRVTSETTSSG